VFQTPYGQADRYSGRRRGRAAISCERARGHSG
jgi:hypothetical protein